MQFASTEDMRMQERWYWLGDAVREAESTYSSASCVEKHMSLCNYLCHSVLCLQCKPIGFRSVTRAERDLSRFHRSIDFLNGLWHFNRTTHLMLLVEMPDKRKAQLMFSCSLEEPQRIECIDVDKVHIIRFLLWVGSQLSSQFAFGSTFMMVWSTSVMPLCYDTRNRKHKLQTQAWDALKRLKSS